jgi:hypothetical protein
MVVSTERPTGEGTHMVGSEEALRKLKIPFCPSLGSTKMWRKAGYVLKLVSGCATPLFTVTAPFSGLTLTPGSMEGGFRSTESVYARVVKGILGWR